MRSTLSKSHALTPYLLPEERDDLLRQLANELNGECITYGQSVQERPLLAVRIPSKHPSQPKRILLCANIHGLELISSLVAMRFLQNLRRPTQALSMLTAQCEIWVIPSINPDGYARTVEQQGCGTLKELRCNSNGVDLNRNFPLPDAGTRPTSSFGGFFGGSNDPDKPFFRGTAPLSEPETAALDALFERTHFHASASLHSCMGALLPPYVQSKFDAKQYKKLCMAFRQAQTHTRYLRLQSRLLDKFTGEMEDAQHHVRGTWSLCVELFPLLASLFQHPRAPNLFWRFNPKNPEPWIQNDIPGLTQYFLQALLLDDPRTTS